jgi:predicted RNase H-like HicB family nuclease
MTRALLAKIKGKKFPIIVEQDESSFYVVECPVFRGCFTQGKTIDEALKNIKEVIELCLEEKENLDILKTYNPRETGLHNITF